MLFSLSTATRPATTISQPCRPSGMADMHPLQVPNISHAKKKKTRNLPPRTAETPRSRSSRTCIVVRRDVGERRSAAPSTAGAPHPSSHACTPVTCHAVTSSGFQIGSAYAGKGAPSGHQPGFLRGSHTRRQEHSIGPVSRTHAAPLTRTITTYPYSNQVSPLPHGEHILPSTPCGPSALRRTTTTTLAVHAILLQLTITPPSPPRTYIS